MKVLWDWQGNTVLLMLLIVSFIHSTPAVKEHEYRRDLNELRLDSTDRMNRFSGDWLYNRMNRFVFNRNEEQTHASLQGKVLNGGLSTENGTDRWDLVDKNRTNSVHNLVKGHSLKQQNMESYLLHNCWKLYISWTSYSRQWKLHGLEVRSTRKLLQNDGDFQNGTKKRDIRLAIILGCFSAFIALLICGPLCCICYGAKRIRDMRSKAAATHSLMFAEQWRAYNLYMPFNEEEELGQHALSWSAWQFVYRGIPDELNGLSTAIFQSIPPVSGCLSGNGQPLQQIRLNPGCARLRRTQSLQCLLPLSPSCHPPNCLPNVNYFEVAILSFSRNGKNGRTSGCISGRVGIGLAARPAPPFRLPGLDMVSLGFHSNGCVYINDPHDGIVMSRRWNYVGVTVGCGYDLERGLVFFTLNGGQPVMTDFAYRADGSMPSTIPHLFPVVGADCDITIVANLGQTEFLYGPANARRCYAEFSENQQEFSGGQVLPDARGQDSVVVGIGGDSDSGGPTAEMEDAESEVYFSASEETQQSFSML